MTMDQGSKCHTCGAMIKTGGEIVRTGRDGSRATYCSLQCRGGPRIVEWVIPRPEQGM